MFQCFHLQYVFLFLASAYSQKSYDFIVVGAGAGGCVVARRLVESGKFSVLLIESGDQPKESYDVPALANRISSDPELTFQFKSTPQNNIASGDNGLVSIVAGRMLGGTTSLNSMFFNRGHQRDWDNWAQIAGDESWKYQNMLKYFKRIEDYQGDFPSDQHGYGGPITVSRPRYAPGLEFWLKAGKELGHSTGDPNGPQKPGFFAIEFSKQFGRRVSSYDGYIKPVLKMQNLHILTNTNVTKVIFRDGRAVGVHFTSTPPQFSVNSAFATKEIIISAGAYSSPLILQRSGIGLRHVLDPASIPIVKELPTGENFHGHPSVNLQFILNDSSVILNDRRDLTPENWKYYNEHGDGPYSSSLGCTGQALFVSSVAKGEGNEHWPDLQMFISFSTEQPFRTAQLPLLTNRSSHGEGDALIMTTVFVGRPKGRGTVRINPDNILGIPLVDMGELTDPRDVQILLEGVQETTGIYEETKAFNSLTPRFAPLPMPACDQFSIKSTEYWKCYIGHSPSNSHHPAGSNKMGKSRDPTAVVDNELRVIGINGLRVIDASIMPCIVNTNLMAAVYAIAEKGADMILKTWESTI